MAACVHHPTACKSRQASVVLHRVHLEAEGCRDRRIQITWSRGLIRKHGHVASYEQQSVHAHAYAAEIMELLHAHECVHVYGHRTLRDLDLAATRLSEVERGLRNGLKRAETLTSTSSMLTPRCVCARIRLTPRCVCTRIRLTPRCVCARIRY